MRALHETTREFDRFGPWVDPVEDVEDVPRLYRTYPLDLDATRLVLKVPRNIARRDANPGMDLYDHLLVLEQERLTVLSRQVETGRGRRGATVPAPGPGYDVRQVPYAQVIAVRDDVDLLDGRLTVRTSDGDSVLVRYNGAARESLGRLVDELRHVTATGTPGRAGAALLAAAPTSPPTGRLDLGHDDVGLVSDFEDAARPRPDLVPWAWHGRRVLPAPGHGANGLVQRALHVLSPMTLHGAVLAGDGRTFEVFGRRDQLLRGSKPVHSSSHLVVPLAALDRIDVLPHPRYPQVVLAVLRAGASPTRLAVPVDSPAHRLLAAAAG